MVKEIKQGVLFTIVTMVLLGGGYHVVLWGDRARGVSRRRRRAA